MAHLKPDYLELVKLHDHFKYGGLVPCISLHLSPGSDLIPISIWGQVWLLKCLQMLDNPVI